VDLQALAAPRVWRSGGPVSGGPDLDPEGRVSGGPNLRGGAARQSGTRGAH